jgi:3-methylfumaryl-CoA hydratase
VLLFRYSAVTFNGHRIHYDRTYATEVENYPGLVVHGPLIATLLLDLVRRSLPEARIARFSFRAMSPLFDIAPFTVNGAPGEGGELRLWAANAAGGLAMSATATLGG